MSAEIPEPDPVLASSGVAHVSEAALRERDPTMIPLLEEEVRVSKREVVTGKVRVRTIVDTTEELVRQELDTEHVSVTRVPVGRYVDAAPAIRTEGDVTIIPVLEEVLVVETKLLLKEEIHIRRTVWQEEVEHSVLLRKQRAVVEQFDDEFVNHQE